MYLAPGAFFKIIFIFCWLTPAASNCVAQDLPGKIQGKIIAITDGDTIEILFNGKPLKIRLAHIDCPEIRKSQPFGNNAKRFTSAMCFGQVVTIVNENKFDRYKRLIGVVINGKGEVVNKEILKAGLGWHFKKYSHDREYAELEKQARNAHAGLWKDTNPIPPWEWRQHQKSL